MVNSVMQATAAAASARDAERALRAGNLLALLALLAAVSGVGSDLTFGGSGVASPTLVISELSVGGT